MNPLLSAQARRQIDRELAKFPVEQKQSAVIAALAIVQAEQGWLSPALLQAVADYLAMPVMAVQEVASFYNMFNTQPVGKHTITVCTNLPCGLSGGNEAAAHLQKTLGIGFGETTADGLFTLKEGECMGACGDAPVMLLDNTRLCSCMSNQKIDAMLDELKRDEAGVEEPKS
jgi:NADH-quinone oxidoreductase subunit E